MKMTKEEYEEARRPFVVMWMDSAGIADMEYEDYTKLGLIDGCPACYVAERLVKEDVPEMWISDDVCSLCPVDFSYLKKVCINAGVQYNPKEDGVCGHRFSRLQQYNRAVFTERRKIASDIANDTKWKTYEEMEKTVDELSKG